MSRVRLIVLVGMMGSGKTTIGRMLAQREQWKFIDSDELIEKKMKRSIAYIFRHFGERKFRLIERHMIVKILREKKHEKLVLSLGGGAFSDPVIRRMAKIHAVTIWLKSSPFILMGRVRSGTRPLLKGPNYSMMRRLCHKRLPYYNQARYRMVTDRGNPQQCTHILQGMLAHVQ